MIEGASGCLLLVGVVGVERAGLPGLERLFGSFFFFFFFFVSFPRGWEFLSY